jgi:N-dimethylarginine dimethylaminohydrolase
VFSDAPWRGIDFERVVELCQSRLRDGGFAYMQGATVALAEGRGDALLDGEHRAQTGSGFRMKLPSAAWIASATGWQANKSSPRKTGKRCARVEPCWANQRLTALRSQSCFSAPS